MEYFIDVQDLSKKQYNELIKLIKKVDANFEGDIPMILNGNNMDYWKDNFLMVIDHDKSKLSYKKQVKYEEFKNILKVHQVQLSRFQPLQDAKEALIEEIEKLSSWTYIHPDEEELNEVLTTAIVSATMLVQRVEQAVAKYEK